MHHDYNAKQAKMMRHNYHLRSASKRHNERADKPMTKDDDPFKPMFKVGHKMKYRENCRLDEYIDPSPPPPLPIAYQPIWHDKGYMVDNRECYDTDLYLELLPDSMYYKNIPGTFGYNSPEWINAKRHAVDRYGYKCVLCGSTDKLNFHEAWEYNHTIGEAKIKEIYPLCEYCHKVKHHNPDRFGDAPEHLIIHFCKVNKCDKEKYYERMRFHRKLAESRNREWIINYNDFI